MSMALAEQPTLRRDNTSASLDIKENEKDVEVNNASVDDHCSDNNSEAKVIEKAEDVAVEARCCGYQLL